MVFRKAVPTAQKLHCSDTIDLQQCHVRSFSKSLLHFVCNDVFLKRVVSYNDKNYSLCWLLPNERQRLKSRSQFFDELHSELQIFWSKQHSKSNLTLLASSMLLVVLFWPAVALSNVNWECNRFMAFWVTTVTKVPGV